MDISVILSVILWRSYSRDLLKVYNVFSMFKKVKVLEFEAFKVPNEGPLSLWKGLKLGAAYLKTLMVGRKVCELRCFENTCFDICAFMVGGIYRKFSFLHFYPFYQVYIIYSIR